MRIERRLKAMFLTSRMDNGSTNARSLDDLSRSRVHINRYVLIRIVQMRPDQFQSVPYGFRLAF